MPVLPRELLVVRNVVLRGAFSSSDYSFRASHFQSSASVGWGPIRLGGSYRTSSQQETVRGRWENDTITIEHPQIIGFFGTLLPKCPNWSPSLAWADTEYPQVDADALPSRQIEDARLETTYRMQEEAARLNAEGTRSLGLVIDTTKRAFEVMFRDQLRAVSDRSGAPARAIVQPALAAPSVSKTSDERP